MVASATRPSHRKVRRGLSFWGLPFVHVRSLIWITLR